MFLLKIAQQCMSTLENWTSNWQFLKMSMSKNSLTNHRNNSALPVINQIIFNPYSKMAILESF